MQLDIGTNNDLVDNCLKKAMSCLNDANSLYENESYNGAANRAYYSIFSSMTAVISLDGIICKSHKQLIGEFNKSYIHQGIFPRSFSKSIKEAEKIRHTGDYDFFENVSKKAAKNQIDFATELYNNVLEYCTDKKKYLSTNKSLSR